MPLEEGSGGPEKKPGWHSREPHLRDPSRREGEERNVASGSRSAPTAVKSTPKPPSSLASYRTWEVVSQGNEPKVASHLGEARGGSSEPSWVQRAEPSNLAGFRQRAVAPPDAEYSPTSPMDDTGEAAKTPGGSEGGFGMPPDTFRVPEGLPSFRKQAGACGGREALETCSEEETHQAESHGGGKAREI